MRRTFRQLLPGALRSLRALADSHPAQGTIWLLKMCRDCRSFAETPFRDAGGADLARTLFFRAFVSAGLAYWALFV